MANFVDKRGLAVTAADDAAVAALDGLVDAFVGFRKDTADRLRAALKADPEAPLAQAASGYLFHMMALRPLVERAAAASARATELAEAAGNPRERLHAAALAAWQAGDLKRAANHLEDILLEYPQDIMALKLAHYLHFYMGDVAAHRDSVARVMPAWTPALPGYASVLGMRAFGLEEAGDYAAAERYGRRAVELDPTDSWSVHAVAHVLEMQGRHREGVAWVDRNAAAWDGVAHNFAFHVWWHKALYHIELEEFDAAIDLYDARVRAEETEDGLDISNAAAMLMRLKLRGVDCGDRWERLAETCAAKRGERVLPFNDLHYVLTLAGAERSEAHDFANDLVAAGAAGADHWAQVYRDVAGPMALGIAAYGAGDYASAVKALLPVRYSWGAIGGSHAQRDVFQQLLIDAAARAGEWRLARALLAERTALKPTSADAWRRLAAASDALGDQTAAADARAEAARCAA